MIDKKERNTLEREQGRRIRDNAETVWGWATPAGVFRVKRRVNEMLKKIGDSNGAKVLELGCGTGIFTEQLAMRNINITALDISLDLLGSAKNKQGVSKILAADAESLPFRAGSFDFVVGVSILHHLDIGKSLREIRRVLKPGGLFVCTGGSNNPDYMVFCLSDWFVPIRKILLLETIIYMEHLPRESQTGYFVCRKLVQPNDERFFPEMDTYSEHW